MHDQLDGCFVMLGIDSIDSCPRLNDPIFATSSLLPPPPPPFIPPLMPDAAPRGASPLPLRGRVCGQFVSPYPSGALSLRARLPLFMPAPAPFPPAPPAPPLPIPPPSMPPIPPKPQLPSAGPGCDVRWRFAPTPPRSSYSTPPDPALGPGEGGSGVESAEGSYRGSPPWCAWCA